MQEQIIILETEEDTLKFAKRFAKALEAPLLITLSGDLGVGKSTLTRALIQALGFSGSIKSPTYTLVETYPFSHLTIHHFDWYRLNSTDELEFIGFRDYLHDKAVNIVEWPEKAAAYVAGRDIALQLQMTGLESRVLKMTSYTSHGKKCLKQLSA